MTCNEIYAAALKLIGEVDDAERTEDYESRAPYIIAGFISDMRKLDNAYRKANGIDSTDVGDTVYIELEKEFPLSDRFCMAAEFYLASMLLIDENSELARIVEAVRRIDPLHPMIASYDFVAAGAAEGDFLEYFVVDESGPDHNKTFWVEARMNSNVIGRGSGRSKREAEQNAALEALKLFGEIE